MKVEEIEQELKDNAKYIVSISVNDGKLLREIISNMLYNEYGSQMPHSSNPRYYGHSAAQHGILHRSYDLTGTQSFSSSLSLKDTLDKHIKKALKKYAKQRDDKPFINRRVESKVQLLPSK